MASRIFTDESKCGIPQIDRQHTYVNLGKTLFQQDLLAKLPAELAHKLGAIPLRSSGNKATAGMVSPADEKAIRSLESLLISPISPVFCFQDELESAIEQGLKATTSEQD